MNLTGKEKIAVASLGCDKNRVDTEVMLGLLKKAGFLITTEEKKADVIIVNSCAFIEDAKEESIDTILSLARNKVKGNCKSLIVAGCLAQRYPKVLLDEMPEIDALVGTGKVPEIVGIVRDSLAGGRACHVGGEGYEYKENYPRVQTTPSHYAYLKISDGCNNRCSYCIIPKLRGDHRSRPMETIIEEANGLAKGGVKELILVAQDTTNYGRDLYGRLLLPELLSRLSTIEGIAWIRLMYAYPDLITQDLIDTMASNRKVCKYIDIPMQHSSGKILNSMGRFSERNKLVDLVGKLRERIPGISIRSTFIVGFPGETEEDFHGLLSFIEEVRLEHIGAFAYSREEGTPAARMAGQIPAKIKSERYGRVMELQAGISLDNNRRLVGKTKTVLVEENLTSSRIAGIYHAGRSEGNAPEVDGNVFFTGKNGVKEGNFVKVRITRAGAYDLFGESV